MTTSSSQPSHSSTILRPLIAAIAVASICIAAGSSAWRSRHLPSPTAGASPRWACHSQRTSTRSRPPDQHHVGRQCRPSPAGFPPGPLTSGHRVVEHRRPLQLRRRRHKPATDRALGSVASSGTGTVFHAARLTNNTGGTITSLDISYVGEQWRNGGNAAAYTLTFQYQVADRGHRSLAPMLRRPAGRLCPR